MNQLVNAISHISRGLVSLPFRVLAYRESVPSGLCGSYVTLSGEGAEYIIGLLSHPVGWETLGQALERDLPCREPRGLVDSACELTKIVAEAFRRRVLDGVTSTVGLPLFADSPVSSGRDVELRAADVAFGSTSVLLVLFSRPQRVNARQPSIQPQESV